MFNKQPKTFKSISDAFTQQFADHAKAQAVIARQQEAAENAARTAKLKAVNEQTMAERAVSNIRNLLTGDNASHSLSTVPLIK